MDIEEILCDLFTDDLDNGSEFTLRKLADDTRPWGVGDTPYGCSSEGSKHVKWATKNVMKFHTDTCTVLPLWRNNPGIHAHWGLSGWKPAYWEGDWGPSWCTSRWTKANNAQQNRPAVFWGKLGRALPGGLREAILSPAERWAEEISSISTLQMLPVNSCPLSLKS